MKIAYLILIISCFVSKLTMGQSDSIRDKFWKEARDNNRGKMKIITNKNVKTNEQYVYRQIDTQLCLINLMMKNKNFYQFFVDKNQLRIICEKIYHYKPKKLSNNYYFFRNDSLMQQAENNKNGLDINELLKMYKIYKAKADSLQNINR